MAPNLSPGYFKIVSLIDGHSAVGVNYTLPAFQRVHLGGPVTTVCQFLVFAQSVRLTSWL